MNDPPRLCDIELLTIFQRQGGDMTTGKEAGGVAVETVFYMNIQVLNSDLKLLKVNPYYQNINLPTHKGSKDE